MKHFFLSAAGVMGFVGCLGGSGTGADPEVEPYPVLLGTADTVVPTDGPGGLPLSLRCVSSPLGEGWGVEPRVVRAWISLDGAGAGVVSLTHGLQFPSHQGAWGEQDATTEERHVARRGDGALVEEAGGGLRVELERDGAVLRGTLVDDQCYVRLETELTCWNDLELFGSPWAGVEGALGARFDWQKGTCLAPDGAPALNATPIEVVRETGNGECADLRGVDLNGADLASPDLDGWALMGSRLDGARLRFANLRFANLQGADMSELSMGYASLAGTIDEHTELPAGNECVVDTSAWAGTSVTCQR